MGLGDFGGDGRATGRVDAAILVAVFCAYLLVRVLWAPTAGFGRYHVTDLLAGIALPSLAALTLRGWPDRATWARSLRGKLALVGGAAIVWEGVVPLMSDRSTADPVDVLCYFAGAVIQHGLATLLRRRRDGA